MKKQHWVFASLTLAVLLRVGAGIPVSTTFVTIGILFMMHILMTELKEGVDAVKIAIGVLGAFVIFLALRYIAAGVIGLYPIDSYDKLNNSGGLFGILPSRDMPKVVVWEALFAFVGGGLAIAWTKNKGRGLVGGIFLTSLAILSIQIALPKYSATFPARGDIDSTLAEKGAIRTVLGAAKSVILPSSSSSSYELVSAPVTRVVTITEKVGKEPKSFRFTSNRSGCATKEIRGDFELYVFGGMDISIEDASGHVDTLKYGKDWRPRGTSVAKEHNDYSFCDLRDTGAAPGDSIIVWAQWQN